MTPDTSRATAGASHFDHTDHLLDTPPGRPSRLRCSLCLRDSPSNPNESVQQRRQLERWSTRWAEHVPPLLSLAGQSVDPRCQRTDQPQYVVYITFRGASSELWQYDGVASSDWMYGAFTNHKHL